MKLFLCSNLLSRIRFKMPPFYAVARGKNVGIYKSWLECQAQVKGFSGARYKKFATWQEADRFMNANGGSANLDPPSSHFDKTVAHKKADPVPFIDFWPEDFRGGEGDDSWIISVAEKIEPIVGKLKRKRQAMPSSPLLEVLEKKSNVYQPVGYKKFGDFEFPIDQEGYVLVYTDGSCVNNGQHNAIAGFGVYFSDEHPLNTAKPVVGRATNNCGEIQASIEAIRIVQRCGIQKIRINTDSQFLINSITMWISSWKRKNWKLGDGTTVKNISDFKQLDEIISDSSIDIKWNYVKGHAKIKGNEKADELARQGALMYKKLHRN